MSRFFSCSFFGSPALPTDLPENRPSFGRGIGGFGDGAADHDVAGAGGNGFGGSDDADLIGTLPPAGRTPGVTMAKASPSSARNVEASRAEVTTPWQPLASAMRGEAHDAVLNRARACRSFPGRFRPCW